MDQSIKHDEGKPRLSLVPTKILYGIAKVREYGLSKYGTSESWRQVEKQRYIDAMLRHIMAFVEDNTSIDEESGYPHLWHAACNIAFLCEDEGKKPIDLMSIGKAFGIMSALLEKGYKEGYNAEMEAGNG